MHKLFTILAVFFIISGCISNSNYKNTAEYNIYSNNSNWLSLPDNITHNADVFYIYPTVCVSETSNKCSIDNLQMHKAAERVIKLQAAAFSKYANIFAPYYTQYDIDVFEYSNYNDIQKAMQDNIQGINEIYAALDYYFKNYNNGRPFILVSHSQGSALMQYVLSDYMKSHKEYYNNMVAAYVIGYPVTKEFMAANPHLKFAEGAEDTGVVIAFDAQSQNKAGIDALYADNRLVINPVNWKRDETYAAKEENLGSLDQKTLEITTPGIADAKIDLKKGIIICSTIDEKKYQIPIPSVFGTGSYHGQIFQLYYVNLGENAKQRIENFINNKKIK